MFQTGKEYETIGVLYLDTETKEFNQQGWTNRMRIKEGADEFELTYKKRYSVADGDIDAALTLGNQQGFDISDTNYRAQIDWGYSNMTLSLSCNKTISNKGYEELELPKKKEAIEMISDKMPGKENSWVCVGWGTGSVPACTHRTGHPWLLSRCVQECLLSAGDRKTTYPA